MTTEANSKIGFNYLKSIRQGLIHPIRNLKNLLDTKGAFLEVLVSDQYRWLYEQIKPDTVLIDLGAHIGDSAFYFASNRNITKIMAYEPTERLFAESQKLLGYSPYKDKIFFYNLAVTHDGDKPTTAYDNGNDARATTLTEVLSKLRNVAIKCDIEGEELHLFDSSDLSNVYAIMLETHNMVHDKVKAALERKGFDVNMKGDSPNRLLTAQRRIKKVD
jgi:hypothetical protein